MIRRRYRDYRYNEESDDGAEDLTIRCPSDPKKLWLRRPSWMFDGCRYVVVRLWFVVKNGCSLPVLLHCTVCSVCELPVIPPGVNMKQILIQRYRISWLDHDDSWWIRRYFGRTEEKGDVITEQAVKRGAKNWTGFFCDLRRIAYPSLEVGKAAAYLSCTLPCENPQI